MTMNREGPPNDARVDRNGRRKADIFRKQGTADRGAIAVRDRFAGEDGVDLPEPEKHESRLGGLERQGSIGLAGLTEPQTMRHYVRLSQKNYSIDVGFYPLGSCTMKHNPRLNEKMARLPDLAMSILCSLNRPCRVPLS